LGLKWWCRWFLVFACFTASTFMSGFFTALMDRLRNDATLFGVGAAVYEAPLIGLRFTLGQAWDAAMTSMAVTTILALLLAALLVKETLEKHEG